MAYDDMAWGIDEIVSQLTAIINTNTGLGFLYSDFTTYDADNVAKQIFNNSSTQTATGEKKLSEFTVKVNGNINFHVTHLSSGQSSTSYTATLKLYKNGVLYKTWTGGHVTSGATIINEDIPVNIGDTLKVTIQGSNGKYKLQECCICGTYDYLQKAISVTTLIE